MSSKKPVTVGEMQIDLTQNRIMVQEDSTYLGPLRAQLLAYLCQNLNQVVSREELSNVVWGRNVSDHTINQHISQLRKIVSSANCHEITISTIPKKGYIVRSDIEAEASPQPATSYTANPKVLILETDAQLYAHLSELKRVGSLKDIDLSTSIFDFHQKAMIGSYQCVIIDVDLARNKGLELIQDIRLSKTCLSADTRIILSSHHVDRNMLGFNVLMDVQGVILKPLDSELMGKQVTMAMANSFQLKPAAAYELVPTAFNTTVSAMA